MLIVGSLDLSTVDGAVPFPLLGQRLMMWLQMGFLLRLRDQAAMDRGTGWFGLKLRTGIVPAESRSIENMHEVCRTVCNYIAGVGQGDFAS
jgi:hypothetical protein